MPGTSTGRFVTSSDGLAIYAEAVGNPVNPSIVFVHGFMLSGVVFDNIFHEEQFSKKYYLVRYDLRGHGRSGKPELQSSYSSQLFADDFAAVSVSFGLIKPVVVGWSLGSTITTDIATYLPDDAMAGAVYIGGGPSTSVFPKIGTPFIMERITAVLSPPSELSQVHHELELFSDSMFHNVETISWRERALWRGMSTFQTPDHRRFVLGREQDSKALFERAEKGFPLLVVIGEHDPYIKQNDLRQLLSEHFTDLGFSIIAGAGHAAHYECTNEVMTKISRFVDRVHQDIRPENKSMERFFHRAFHYFSIRV